jgi:hypothetical protein
MVSDVIMFGDVKWRCSTLEALLLHATHADRTREKARKKRKPAVAGKSILHTAMGDVRGLALCSEGLALY